MENTIVINKQKFTVKQYKGQRVLTFKDIDTVHSRADGTAGRNFRANKAHFIEGEDFFKIQPDEIRRVGITSPNGGIVLTESGYLMLAKSLTDDLAWKVQRELVNNYFRVKPHQECKQMTFDDYEYVDKTFRGQPVLSIADIAAMVNMERSTIGYAVRRYLKANEDYYLLEKSSLAAFKRENPKFYRHVGSMYAVTASGFDKLCKIYGIKVDKPKLFIEEKPKEQNYPAKVITPQIKGSMAEIRREAQRLINLTYLLDDGEGQFLCGETYHQCKSAIIRQMKAIGSCLVIPQKNNY